MLFEHFWLFFILSVFISVLYLKHRVQKYIAKNPELKKGYDRYLRGFLVFGNIPFVIMGIGQVSGMTKNTFEYSNPATTNPIILCFWVYLILIYILMGYKIYFKNGAEFIEQHPGLILVGGASITAIAVKLLFPVFALVGIGAVTMMWFLNIAVS